MPRKIVQFQMNEAGQVVALADDGTLWRRNNYGDGKYSWAQTLPDIPQDGYVEPAPNTSTLNIVHKKEGTDEQV